MRPAQYALLFAAALGAHAAAYAGEVSLYSGANLTGRQSVVRADIENLQSTGFNDRTMSLVVHEGRWEACTDAEFRGECRVFDTGSYRNLDRFAQQISSLREIAAERGNGNGYGRGRGRGRDREREPSLTLFDNVELRGRSIALRNDANTLVPLGFNDATQSMVVRGGSWELCQHTDYRGQCRVFAPGEYRNLDRSFYRAISSARRIGGNEDRRGDYGQGDGYRDGRDGYRDGRDADYSAVELYTSPGFGGRRIPVNEEVRSLENTGVNDRIGSLVIQSGEWEFCQHAEFRGSCMVYGPGRYDNLGSMQNQISSLRRVR